MKRIILRILDILFGFPFFESAIVWSMLAMLLAASVGAQTPPILIGADAQPVENFDKIKGLGLNALHRYDPGPQKNVSIDIWLAEAHKRGLASLIQGTKVTDWTKLPASVVAISHDDEPDLNRYDAARSNPDVYSPTDAPHKSVIGWTKPTVLEARTAAWRQKTKLPIVVNFAGPQLNSTYYAPPLPWHAGYIKATDAQGLDLYPRNNGANGNLYWPVNSLDKLRRAGGNPLDLYVETSDQKLGRGGRGPTPAEQSTLMWSGLAHGARRLWIFPQQVKPGDFKYWAMTPENEQQLHADAAMILGHAELIAGGKLTLTQTPPFAADYAKGTATYPTSELAIWSNAGGTLSVAIDYTGAKAPVATFTPAPTSQPTIADVLKRLDALEGTLNELRSHFK